jgi:hypothetical protein
MHSQAQGARFDESNKRLAPTQRAQIRSSKLGKLFLATSRELTLASLRLARFTNAVACPPDGMSYPFRILTRIRYS